MSLYLNKFDTEQGLMVAVADQNLIGSEFKENGVSLKVASDFYCGEVTESETIAEQLSSASIANLVGEKAVDLGIEEGVIDEGNVLEVEDVPHAQMVRI